MSFSRTAGLRDSGAGCFLVLIRMLGCGGIGFRLLSRIRFGLGIGQPVLLSVGCCRFGRCQM